MPAPELFGFVVTLGILAGSVQWSLRREEWDDIGQEAGIMYLFYLMPAILFFELQQTDPNVTQMLFVGLVFSAWAVSAMVTAYVLTRLKGRQIDHLP